ncbi:hypothetical protein BV898_17757 [Hypsibius exemplaris]|nr:hypothetical protein BV898_17757 [Hypsibius exemplaris]
MEAKNGKIFRVHSTVLQLNGGFLGQLAANITPGNLKPTLKFPDLTEAVLKKLLEYCYTLQVSGIHKTPFELLLAAHRYALTGLQDLAEKDVARCIDLDNVLDLYVWNEFIQSTFLASFIALFFTVNFVQIRQLPEFQEKLTAQQQATLEARYKSVVQTSGELSEGGEGFISEDNDEDGDSGTENDTDTVFHVSPYDPDNDNVNGGDDDAPSAAGGGGEGLGMFLSGNGNNEDNEDNSFGQEEDGSGGNAAEGGDHGGEFGDEPDEQQFQLDALMMMNAAAAAAQGAMDVNVIVNNQAEVVAAAGVDQAAVIAQIFGDLGGLDPDALDFLMMLM